MRAGIWSQPSGAGLGCPTHATQHPRHQLLLQSLVISDSWRQQWRLVPPGPCHPWVGAKDCSPAPGFRQAQSLSWAWGPTKQRGELPLTQLPPYMSDNLKEKYLNKSIPNDFSFLLRTCSHIQCFAYSFSWGSVFIWYWQCSCSIVERMSSIYY